MRREKAGHIHYFDTAAAAIAAKRIFAARTIVAAACIQTPSPLSFSKKSSAATSSPSSFLLYFLRNSAYLAVGSNGAEEGETGAPRSDGLIRWGGTFFWELLLLLLGLRKKNFFVRALCLV